MTVNERITTAERYAKAVTSGHLEDDALDLDVLIAAGMATKSNPARIAALRVQRMVDSGDSRDLWVVVEHYSDALNYYLQRGGRRQMNRDGRRAIVVAVLNYLLHPKCDFCGGTGKFVQEGTAGLRSDPCTACHGSSKKPLDRAVPAAHKKLAHWLVDEINQSAKEAVKHMSKVLAGQGKREPARFLALVWRGNAVERHVIVEQQEFRNEADAREHCIERTKALGEYHYWVVRPARR